VTHGLPIRQLLAVLLAIPAFALTFFVYQTGNIYVALALLVVTCLGVYTYVSPSASTFRYLFPGFLGFGLFVIFPLVYTIYIGFTKYSSENLLTFDRALSLFRQETFTVDTAISYKYTLYSRDGGQYALYLEDEKDPNKRFVSEAFNLEPGAKPNPNQGPIKLKPLPAGRRNGPEHFVHALRRGEPFMDLCSAETGLAAQEILSAGLKSERTGRRIYL